MRLKNKPFMRTLLGLCALALASCGTTGTTGTTGTAAKVQLPSDLQNAIAEYRACLDAHPKRTKACEAQRVSMEAEERAYFSRPVGTQDAQTR
jgi:hypothetical protein